MKYQQGLTTKQAKELQIKYGRNEIQGKHQGKIIEKAANILKEPIYILLACSAFIYFLLGETMDGSLMILFVLFVIGIDVLQEMKTGNALSRLKEFTEPKIKVIRDGKETKIDSVDLVPGDVMLISEGVKIPADGSIQSANGLCIDESLLTGEAEAVWKTAEGKLSREEETDFFRKDYCYMGTMVTLGNATVLVKKIGMETEYGQIADKIAKLPTEYSMLQKQMKKLAKQCTRIAAVFLLLVSVATFINLSYEPMGHRFVESFLAGVVLALSMVPGEFPVIQSVFLSMGALRLAKKHALIRRLSAVETLGAVSVLCVDKTGTITHNNMEVEEVWHTGQEGNGLCRAIALSCKENAYDPMEMALLNYCGIQCHKGNKTDCVKACVLGSGQGKFIREYAFTNELKAMGQVWHFDHNYIVAAKGSTETILPLCNLSKDQENVVNKKICELSNRGLRMIAVAERSIKSKDDIPESLIECKLFLKGIIGLSDPPREDIEEKIKVCYQAGIRIIMITGDHPATALSIAKAIGIKNSEKVLTGDEISKLKERELQEAVKNCNLFARVLPLHKMRIVKALKENGEITAMTGDGVNDSAALKIADIGVAMGKHGSEVSREAADLILLDDNLQTIIDSVSDGRRIYQNIKKAIGYVLAIHIPIALISLIAPLIGIRKEALMLLPLHIILLELVMDPTCSVALERQPAEDDILRKPPRKTTEQLMTTSLLLKSIFQGFVIFGVSFSLYFGLLQSSYPAEIARTAGYTVLVLANIFLVMVNCSDHESILHTLKKIKKERGIWLLNLVTLLELCLMVYSPLGKYLQFKPLSLPMLFGVICLSIVSVLWYEIVKFIKRIWWKG